MNTEREFAIVGVDKFTWATRDSGYKGTPSAAAELIDNALQAVASEISVRLTMDNDRTEHPLVLSVFDNGSGMDAVTLRMALRFGESTRFNDRRSLGRHRLVHGRRQSAHPMHNGPTASLLARPSCQCQSRISS